MLGGNLHSNFPSSYGSRVSGRLHFTARLPPPKQKLQECTKEDPPPSTNPTTRLLPAPLGPRPRGGGELSPEEERSAPLRRSQTRAGSAAPPPAPHSPARAAGPLNPRIMHGPGAPSALPPQEDTIYVRGGLGPGKQERRGGWSPSRAPRGAGWRGRGRVGEAGCLEGNRRVQRPGSSAWEPPPGP